MIHSFEIPGLLVPLALTSTNIHSFASSSVIQIERDVF